MMHYLLVYLIFNHGIILISSTKSSKKYGSDEELKNSPPDHVIPYSEHENPPEPPTKPEYIAPGVWARPTTDENITLDFVPTRLYAQVRHSDTVKRIPRKQALAEAKNDEERENIGRLREVVKKQKVNTYYTEEGYEDAAYDHAGHIRDADYDENYDKNYAKKEGDPDSDKDDNNRKYKASKNSEDHNDDDDGQQESVESKKSAKLSPYKGFYHSWEESGINPQRFAKTGIRQLESDLIEKNREASRGAETEVPENLKNLVDNSESAEDDDDHYEYKSTPKNSYFNDDDDDNDDDDKFGSTKNPFNYNSDEFRSSFRSFHDDDDEFVSTKSTLYEEDDEDNDISDSSEFEKKSESTFRIVAAPYTPDRIDNNTIVSQESPQIAQSTTSTPILSIYSTEAIISTPEAVIRPEALVGTPGAIIQPEFLVSTPEAIIRPYPSISQVYESWKRRGIEEKYEESSPELRDGEQNLISNSDEDYSSSDQEEEKSDEVEAGRKLNKNYVLLVRSPLVPCNESAPSKKPTIPVVPGPTNPYLRKKNISNQEKLTVMHPPGSTRPRQVTYANYLSKNQYNRPVKSSMTAESGSVEEYTQDNNKPPSFLLYRYQQKPYIRHNPALRQDLKNHLLPLIRMHPPSPISRSQYAEYKTEKQSGSNKPRRELRPELSKKRLSVFRINRKTGGKRQRYSPNSRGSSSSSSGSDSGGGDDNDDDDDDDKKFSYEKVPLKGVNIPRRHRGNAKRNFIVSRQKRDTRGDLLNDAPRVVEEVIDEEINARFPESDENSEDDKKSVFVSEEKNSVNDDDDEKVDVEVPDFNFSDVQQHVKHNEKGKQKIRTPKKMFDDKKYPFYRDNSVSRSSALKYITNPLYVPRKTFGGTEFYDSRDKYLECEEIDPDLSKVAPEDKEENSEAEQDDPKTNLPRLHGLGDKISCFKAKYFDKNPLDNPLFAERRIEPPDIPEELNLDIFKSRISHLKSDPDVNIYRRVSRKPEIIDIRPLESRRNEIVDQDTHSKNRRNQPERPITWTNHARRYRTKTHVTTDFPFVPYQRLVYEDVMGTIKNLSDMYRQPSTSRPLLVPPRGRKKNIHRSPKYSPHTHEKKDEEIYITTVVPETSKSTLPTTKNRYRKHNKLIPYRTNKVTYRTRPMTRRHHGNVRNKTVGYFKTVRVHKRETENSELDDSDESDDLNVGETRGGYIQRVNSTNRQQFQRPIINHFNNFYHRKNNSNNTPEVIAEAKKIYTIIDRMKNSKSPVKAGERYGNFIKANATVSAAAQTATRRNEPTYTPIRKFDGDIYKVKHVAVNDPKKFDSRYDVHESVTEGEGEVTEGQSNPATLKYEDDTKNESENNYSAHEESGDGEENSESTYSNKNNSHDSNDDDDDDDDDDNDKYKNEDESKEQIEKPYASGSGQNSGEYKDTSRSDEDESSGDSDTYDNAEKNFFTMSDNEKDFERFNSRPLSPSENFHDPKYDDLGPRINKPAFHHPSFDSVGRKRHKKFFDDSESEEDDEKNSKSIKSEYVFPWHEDDDDASEESKRHESITGKHEFPWERRARLRAMRRKLDRKLSDEHHPSESVGHAKKIHPWDDDYHHFKHYGFSSFWPDEFDSHGFSSEIYERKSKPQNSNSEELSKTIEDDKEEKSSILGIGKIPENMTGVATTSTPQIPATSAEFMTVSNRATTPTIPVTTSRIVYTVRPKTRTRGSIRHNNGNHGKDLDKSESKIEVSSTPHSLRTSRRRKINSHANVNSSNNYDINGYKNDNSNYNNNNNGNNYRRRFRMTSSTTTIRPLHGKLSNNGDNKSTTPTTRKIEHRSKVSKEERITKTLFPVINSGRNDSESNADSTRNQVVQKVSIVTKETPEHIYQTKEIDDNGKKNMFVSIIPNNNTEYLESSYDTREMMDDMSIERVGLDDLDKYKNRENDDEEPTLDVSLPLNDKLKLTEHGAKKIMTSVSFISKNYDW